MTSLSRAQIGLDLGGTAIKGGVLLDRVTLAQTEVHSPPSFEACVAALAEVAKDLQSHANLAKIERVGLAVPGVLNPQRDGVLDAPNLPFLENQPLEAALSKQLDCPVILENDGTAAAHGEACFGDGGDNFLLFTLGTGIGGGLFLDGKVWRGPGGLAGEFGHITVNHEHLCRCGARGCLEAIASAGAMVRLAGEQGAEYANLESLAQAARGGNKSARSIFRNAGNAIGEALAQVALLLDVRKFLVGGGGAPTLDLLRDPALRVLAARAFGRDAADFQILPAQLGNRAGWLGAALSVSDLAKG